MTTESRGLSSGLDLANAGRSAVLSPWNSSSPRAICVRLPDGSRARPARNAFPSAQNRERPRGQELLLVPPRPLRSCTVTTIRIESYPSHGSRSPAPPDCRSRPIAATRKSGDQRPWPRPRQVRIRRTRIIACNRRALRSTQRPSACFVSASIRWRFSTYVGERLAGLDSRKEVKKNRSGRVIESGIGDHHIEIACAFSRNLAPYAIASEKTAARQARAIAVARGSLLAA